LASRLRAEGVRRRQLNKAKANPTSGQTRPRLRANVQPPRSELSELALPAAARNDSHGSAQRDRSTPRKPPNPTHIRKVPEPTRDDNPTSRASDTRAQKREPPCAKARRRPPKFAVKRRWLGWHAGCTRGRQSR
jgi:hypothetical protein